jgi:hypothetical protein
MFQFLILSAVSDKLIEVLLVICVFEKCYFISMRAPNLDRFQLTALALMWILEGRSSEAGRRGSRVLYRRQEEEWEGRRDFLFCDFSLKHNCHINRGVPVYLDLPSIWCKACKGYNKLNSPNSSFFRYSSYLRRRIKRAVRLTCAATLKYLVGLICARIVMTKYRYRVKLVTCHHDMAHPQFADRAECLTIWRVTANIASWISSRGQVTRGDSPAWRLGRVLTTP